jgi:hypothetical protein
MGGQMDFKDIIDKGSLDFRSMMLQKGKTAILNELFEYGPDTFAESIVHPGEESKEELREKIIVVCEYFFQTKSFMEHLNELTTTMVQCVKLGDIRAIIQRLRENLMHTFNSSQRCNLWVNDSVIPFSH